MKAQLLVFFKMGSAPQQYGRVQAFVKNTLGSFGLSSFLHRQRYDEPTINPWSKQSNTKPR